MRPRKPPGEGRDPFGRKLTPRQISVLAGLAAGLTAAEIAAERGISPNNVNAVSYALRQRLGARSAAHAVALGYQQGLLPAPQRQNEEQPE